MINIAIVDDNTAFLQEMKQNIEACKEFTADMVCDTYCSGADFLQADCGGIPAGHPGHADGGNGRI